MWTQIWDILIIKRLFLASSSNGICFFAVKASYWRETGHVWNHRHLVAMETNGTQSLCYRLQLRECQRTLRSFPGHLRTLSSFSDYLRPPRCFSVHLRTIILFRSLNGSISSFSGFLRTLRHVSGRLRNLDPSTKFIKDSTISASQIYNFY